MPLMSLRRSCSVSPAAHCHLRGTLCPDLAQPYPTPRRLWRGDRGIELGFLEKFPAARKQPFRTSCFPSHRRARRTAGSYDAWVLPGSGLPPLILARVLSLGPIPSCPCPGWLVSILTCPRPYPASVALAFGACLGNPFLPSTSSHPPCFALISLFPFEPRLRYPLFSLILSF